ncbi:hypothetical protein FKM82_024864 [Ascaphus truei]
MLRSSESTSSKAAIFRSTGLLASISTWYTDSEVCEAESLNGASPEKESAAIVTNGGTIESSFSPTGSGEGMASSIETLSLSVPFVCGSTPTGDQSSAAHCTDAGSSRTISSPSSLCPSQLAWLSSDGSLIS